MAYVLCFLMQENGVPGPSEGIEVPDNESTRTHLTRGAVWAWVQGQTGHPWDLLTASVYKDQEDYESSADPSIELEYRLNYRDGGILSGLSVE